MATGDHLVVQYGAYTHHGIDVGNGMVIHYGRGLHNKRNARVEVVAWDMFAGQYPVRIEPDAARFSPQLVVARAWSRLSESDYDVFDNNCEHFVNWCRLGIADSRQANLVDSVCRRSGAAAVKLAVPRLAQKLATGKLAVRAAGAAGLPAALAGDAVQFSAEILALRQGKDRSQTGEIGRRSGALASSGVGFLLGGPAGAAVGFGSWLLGELIGEQTSAATRDAMRAATAR
ncbi:MAG: lecithin retinol acyltransferase family protein [Pirellulaceae bacterium]